MNKNQELPNNNNKLESGGNPEKKPNSMKKTVSAVFLNAPPFLPKQTKRILPPPIKEALTTTEQKRTAAVVLLKEQATQLVDGGIFQTKINPKHTKLVNEALSLQILTSLFTELGEVKLACFLRKRIDQYNWSVESNRLLVERSSNLSVKEKQIFQDALLYVQTVMFEIVLRGFLSYGSTASLSMNSSISVFVGNFESLDLAYFTYSPFFIKVVYQKLALNFCEEDLKINYFNRYIQANWSSLSKCFIQTIKDGNLHYKIQMEMRFDRLLLDCDKDSTRKKMIHHQLLILLVEKSALSDYLNPDDISNLWLKNFFQKALKYRTEQQAEYSREFKDISQKEWEKYHMAAKASLCDFASKAQNIQEVVNLQKKAFGSNSKGNMQCSLFSFGYLIVQIFLSENNKN